MSQLLKSICGGHQVNQSPLFRYLKNGRITQRQLCRPPLDSVRIKTVSRFFFFSPCSAFVRRRQSNMNFSGFEKEKKHPLKVLCLTVRLTNAQRRNTQLLHIQSDRRLAPLLPTDQLLLIQGSLFCSSSLCKQQLSDK